MQSPDFALQLRAARPVASADLRERVREIAARPVAEPRRRFDWPVRRIALVAAPALVAVALGIAVVHGIVSPTPQTRRALHGSAVTRQRLPLVKKNLTQLNPIATHPLRAAQTIPNVPTRLQQYGATLRVQVKDRQELSDATKHAVRFARLLGGYVAAVHYSAPHGGQGSAEIVVRVPVDRVQDAIEEYAGLGTLLAQRVAISDVTKAVTEQSKEIARLQREIAAIEAGGVSYDERPRLERLQARLDYLTKRKTATVRRAQLARVSLALVTKPKHTAAASRFHRTLSDAGSILVRELELLVYALIVAGPLLLLGAAAIAAGRLRDRRLFERT